MTSLARQEERQAEMEMDTNARLALLAHDALSLRLNVRRCRIIHGQKISTHLDR